MARSLIIGADVRDRIAGADGRFTLLVPSANIDRRRQEASTSVDGPSLPTLIQQDAQLSPITTEAASAIAARPASAAPAFGQPLAADLEEFERLLGSDDGPRDWQTATPANKSSLVRRIVSTPFAVLGKSARFCVSACFGQLRFSKRRGVVAGLASVAIAFTPPFLLTGSRMPVLVIADAQAPGAKQIAGTSPLLVVRADGSGRGR